MKASSPKTLEDFPKFIVTALRLGPTPHEGYRSFELEENFDRKRQCNRILVSPTVLC